MVHVRKQHGSIDYEDYNMHIIFLTEDLPARFVPPSHHQHHHRPSAGRPYGTELSGARREQCTSPAGQALRAMLIVIAAERFIPSQISRPQAKRGDRQTHRRRLHAKPPMVSIGLLATTSSDVGVAFVGGDRQDVPGCVMSRLTHREGRGCLSVICTVVGKLFMQ